MRFQCAPVCTDTNSRENKGIGKLSFELLTKNRCSCNHGGLVSGSLGVVGFSHHSITEMI